MSSFLFDFVWLVWILAFSIQFVYLAYFCGSENAKYILDFKFVDELNHRVANDKNFFMKKASHYREAVHK